MKKQEQETFTNSPNLCPPGTAFGLGMIPGVGALCNGEYLLSIYSRHDFGFPDLDCKQSRARLPESMFTLLTVASLISLHAAGGFPHGKKETVGVARIIGSSTGQRSEMENLADWPLS
jgi:hypothetical protein